MGLLDQAKRVEDDFVFVGVCRICGKDTVREDCGCHSPDTFVSDPRPIKAERIYGERFTESRPQLLSVVPRTNHPTEIDLLTYTPEERDRLARVALWLASHEHDSRFLETVTGAARHSTGEVETLLRIRLSVFEEQVSDVLRGRSERLEVEAEDEAQAF